MTDDPDQPTSNTSISGGVDVDAQRDVNIGGDVVGRDKIEQHTTNTTFDQREQNVGTQYNVAGDLHVSHIPPSTSPGVSREQYLAALAQFCNELPYVSLKSRRSLAQVYVLQQAREERREQLQSVVGQHAEQRDDKSKPISIEDMIATHELVALVGAAGSGKSTALRYLVEQQLVRVESNNGLQYQATSYLPVLVSLRGLAVRQGDLQTCLRGQIEVELGKRLHTRLPENFLLDWQSETGQSWLIALDGLDEVVDADRRYNLLRELNQNSWPSGTRLIISTRHDDVLKTANRFQVFDILPFGKRQIDLFAHQWFALKKTAAEEFLQSISASGLETLINTPLFLTVAATVFEKAAEQPSSPNAGKLTNLRRSALLESFVKAVLDEDAEPNRQMREQFTELFHDDVTGTRLFEDRREILAQIAFDILKDKPASSVVSQFLRSEAPIQRLDGIDEKTSSVLDILVQQRTSLLTRRGDNFEFIHQEFRDYLAAVRISGTSKMSVDYLWKEALIHWRDEQWREVAKFVLELLPEDDKLITPLLRRVHQPTKRLKWGVGFKSRARTGAPDWEELLFVGEMLAEQIKVNTDWANSFIEEFGLALIERARTRTYGSHNSSDYSTEIENPINYLSRMQTYPRAGDVLRAIALDGHIEFRTRCQAAESLATFGQADDAVTFLLALAYQVQSDLAFSYYSAHTLSDLDHYEDAAEIWFKMALAPTFHFYSVRTRTAAAEALTKTGPANLAALAWQVIVEDLLGRLAGDDTSWDYKDLSEYLEVAEVLVRCDQPDLAALILVAVAVPPKYDQWTERFACREAIERLGQLGRGDDLLKVACTGGFIHGNQAWGEIWRLRQPDVLQRIADSEGIGSDGDRLLAIKLLMEMGRSDDSVIQPLVGLIHNIYIDSSLRESAIQLLGQLLPLELREMACGSTLSEKTRLYAAEVLRNLGQISAAIEVESSLSLDQQARVEYRLRAVAAIGETAPADVVVQACLMLLRDVDESHLQSYVTNYRQIQDQALEIFRKLVRLDVAIQVWNAVAYARNIDYWTRLEAIESLISLGQIELAWKGCLALLVDEPYTNPIHVLGKIGQVDVLLSLIDNTDFDNNIQVEAVKELGRMGFDRDLLKLVQEKKAKSDVLAQAIQELVRLDRFENLLLLADIPNDLLSAIVIKAFIEQRRSNVLLSFLHEEQINIDLRYQCACALCKFIEEEKHKVGERSLLPSADTGNVLDVEYTKLLAQFKQDDALTAVLLRLVGDELMDSEMRLTAAQTLVEFGYTSEAIIAWQSIARDGEADPECRLKACEALAHVGRTNEATSMIMELTQNSGMLQSDLSLFSTEWEIKSHSLRLKAAMFLTRLNRSDEAGIVLREFRRKGDSIALERYLAARMLADLGWIEDAAEMLLDLVRDPEASSRVRGDAIKTLENLQQPALALQGWLVIANDENMEAEWRFKAVQSLALRGRGNEAKVTLFALARQENVSTSVRREVAQSLIKLGDIETGVAALKSVSDAEYIQALIAVGATDWVTQALFDLACDSTVYIEDRYRAAHALLDLRRVSEATRAWLVLAQASELEERYNDHTFKTVSNVLVELGRQDEAAEIWLTVGRNGSKGSWMRYEAGRALMNLHRTKELAVILLQIAEDSNESSEERRGAASKLREIGESEYALRAYHALAYDDAGAVWMRNDAAEQLITLGQPASVVVPVLLAIALNPNVDEHDRRVAANKLNNIQSTGDAINAWRSLAEQSLEKSEHFNAITKLWEIGAREQAVQICLDRARNSTTDAVWRRWAAEKLQEFDRVTESSMLWFELASDPAVDIKTISESCSALEALKQVEYLRRIAFDSTKNVRLRLIAGESLRKLGQASTAIQAYLEILRTGDPIALMRLPEGRLFEKLLGYENYSIEWMLSLAIDQTLNAHVRKTAIWNLAWEQDDPRKSSELSSLAQDDPDGTIRQHAHAAIRLIQLRGLKPMFV